VSPLAKSALTWVSVLAACVVFFTLRFEYVQGLFSSLPSAPSRDCSPVAAGLKDPADLVVDSRHGVAFIAAMDRQAMPAYSNSGDGLYALNLNDPQARPVRLAGPPPGIHPYAVSLDLADDGSESLTVIDRRANGRHFVEMYGVSFDGDTPKLSQQTAVQGGLLVSPNGVAAIGPGRFYVSNDRVTKGAIGRFAEDYLLWPHADVMAFNGMGFRIATQRLLYPAGLLARGGILYLASANERSVIAYSRQDITGELTEIGSVSLPARPSRISADAGGNLIVAGETKPGSSQVFRIGVNNQGVPQSYDMLFSDDGQRLRGASAAAIANGQLLIGAADDDKMLACKL
jgi:arylesterase/paraoxonase